MPIDLKSILKQHICDARLKRDQRECVRVKGQEYYDGAPLGNERNGFSQHVCMDVFDAVESTKARLLATFSSSRRIVEFSPRDPDDVEAAAIRNKYLDQLFWEKNSGYKLLHDGIHNALIGSIISYRWWWKASSEIVRHPFQGTREQLQGVVLQRPDDQFELHGEQDGIITGDLITEVDTSQVEIATVAPQRLLIDINADDSTSAVFIGEDARYTGSELVEMGVDPDRLKHIAEYDGITRDHPHLTESLLPEQREYSVFDGWIKIDTDGDGISELYRVLCDSDGQLLIDPTPAKSIQMVAGSLLPIPHELKGKSLAELLFGIQYSSSNVMRQQIDHLARVNSGRLAADFELVRNPVDLIENRVGAVVDMDLSRGIAPVQALAQPQLSPATLSVGEALKQEKEQRSGVSRLAQGLNQDALSSQNAASKIDQLTNLSTARVMMMARHMAEMILKPLLKGVYQCATEHDDRPISLSISGKWVEVSPKQLAGHADLSTTVAVTDEEAAQRAQSLMSLHGALKQSPALYPEQYQFALLSDVARLVGHEGHLYIQNPESEKLAPNIAQIQMQNQQLQQQAQILMQQNQALMQQLGDRNTETLLRQASLKLKASQGQQRIDIERQDKQHGQMMDEAELMLARQQSRAGNG